MQSDTWQQELVVVSEVVAAVRKLLGHRHRHRRRHQVRSLRTEDDERNSVLEC